MSDSERYIIQAKIGQGGVGAVYRAYDSSLRRDVAIKRLLPQDEKPEEARHSAEELIKEAGLLSKLQHPNIVTVYDVGIDDDGGYVVMELIDGETFDATIARGALTGPDFSQVVDQTLEAMTAAQEIDLLHRDIKPSNVMVSWLPSGRFQVKVLDFGLAKLTQVPALQTINHGDSIMGSIYFMAPEQFDRELLDARTDLYSLGCLYYYGLAGRYPFDGKEAPNVMIAHLEHEVRPLHELRPDLPAEACDWVMRLISKEMDDRPASASQALEEFAPVTKAIQRAAHPQVETAEIPPAPPPSPNRPQLITGPVTTVTGPVAPAHPQVTYPTSLHTTSYQMPPNRGTPPWLLISIWTLVGVSIIGGAWLLFGGRGSSDQEETPPPRSSQAVGEAEAPPPAATSDDRQSPSLIDPKAGRSPQRFVSASSRWRYFDGDVVPTNWSKIGFDDTSWPQGKSPLGFGDPVATEVVKPGDRKITYYFRKTIRVKDAASASDDGSLVANIQYDDGFRMFLNGKEILRKELPEGEIDSQTLASAVRQANAESEFVRFDLPLGLLKNGKNVFAVEVHQVRQNSSDLRFSMVLDYYRKGQKPRPITPAS